MPAAINWKQNKYLIRLSVVTGVLMFLFFQIFFVIMFIPFTRMFESELEFAFGFYQLFAFVIILLLLVLYRFEFKKYQPEQFAFDDEGVHLKYHNREMPVLIPWTEIKSVETSRLIMCFYIYKNPNYKYRISLGPEVSKFIDLSTKLETRHKYRIPLGPEVSDFDDLFSEVEKYRDNYHFEID